MVEALVKGETHLSKRDKRALMKLDLSSFDAVFREGHDKDYFERKIDSLYALFAIGHVVYGATYGRLYMPTEDFKAKAQNQGLPFHGEIDAAIHETYEMVPGWKRGLLFLFSPIYAALILGIITAPFQWLAKIAVPGIIPQLQLAAAVGLMFLYGFAWALAYFLLIENRVMYDRDECMAEEILKTAENEGYQSVLITCGGNHRPGIADYLREEGWQVEERTTDSPIGKVLLWKDRVIERLPSPRKKLNQAASKLRGRF
ncbi:hypothetical protein E6P09_19365 (plasmid) [Haloferax mediterranei ATCC 33500]|uniref:Uncharacterized protein n=1 Tax=Haloferax mediterranei (strain ATCC 33500 / DSM 1411 / JCM 8866 / NBRC 14739 / NCIMB 2177 / R-4) TaxID=523841 RepID=I3R984_HALMT|nr:hypothetical protein [Haloferax mediterranei]AFK20794.1 hypothetical protein HFX_4103 [Haloferax mediterranei ATCC 33500]AHZ23965.1 hypothetical protein BM92_19295 [Haloferax mediterranei ATCC 33500]ELZ97534.1 hypothetical protein C439_16488 [Haloferax mediterranei ATCC 33500]MDX5989632.1 hypothetical protein [Haloferax mediterranei ATCC 33500]QCQ77467.1 hypothetical protein E6P09_19365 [Haloferax mediterranei ATCC 33500]